MENALKLEKKTDYEALKSGHYVLIKIRETNGHFFAFRMGEQSAFYIPDNCPSEEPFSNIEYYIDIGINNKI